VVEKIAGVWLRLSFGYESMNAVMKVLKEMDLPQRAQDFGQQCSLEVRVRLSALDSFREKMGTTIKIEEI